ncbi:hypothetical protein G5S37_25425 [Roseimicrobium sp. ORNL1]|nr:hypothetical protein G5S37_25425 [Roseimicrobium sp. ORNL1]
MLLLQEAFTAHLDDLADLGTDQHQHPPFKPDVALDALRCLYRICHGLVDRALPAGDIEDIFSDMPPAPVDAGDMLSADVALRHLPTIHRWAKSLSADDPLVLGLSAIGLRFPLSSVGMGPLPLPLDLAPLKRHPQIWRWYVDRVIERQDESRLTDPEVKAAVRDALGAHHSLAQRLALAAAA